MINLSVEELKIITNFREVKSYKSESKDEIIKIPSKPKPKIN